jgi:hypothetical protein|tara:strand:+ start:5317 stop:5793 length:477 start_codon:yes stop_codon:yes gene_type:complete
MDSVVETTPEGHSIRVTTEAHIKELKENLREMDKVEVACFKSTPEDALNKAFTEDDITLTVVTKHGSVMAIFGAGRPKDPYIWMLGSPEVDAYSKDFIKHCRKWVWALTELYGQVSNYIHAENFICLKWLEWCGATLSAPLIINGESFRKFTITRDKL